MKSTKSLLLSHPIEENTPLYGNTPAPVIKPFSRISDGANSNSSIINIHNHVGTHIDAPAHFVEGGKKISDYSLDELIFKYPLLLECSADVDEFIPLKKILSQLEISEKIDCLLLKTGFSKHRLEKVYRTNNPGILSDDIHWLRKKFSSIRCIGIDSLSISGYNYREEGRKSHLAAFLIKTDLGKPLLIIEDMNLTNISQNQYIEYVFVVPWQISGIDSAPCTVIAKVGNLR